MRNISVWIFKFFQRQMYCWCKYFSVQTLFLLYLVSWVGAVSNMCDSCLFLVFSGLTHVLSLVYELLINALANFFRKIIKLSSVLSKYCISIYAFTSVHAMKKQKLGWATRTFPIHSPNQFGIYSLHHASRHCDYPPPPFIYNYPQQLQYTLTLIPTHSPSFSLPYDPPA